MSRARDSIDTGFNSDRSAAFVKKYVLCRRLMTVTTGELMHILVFETAEARRSVLQAPVIR